MSKKSDVIASFIEEEGDNEDMEKEFQQLRLSHQRVHHVTQRANRAASDVYGIATLDSFDEDDESDRCYQEGEESEFGHRDDKTVSTCSISVASTVSSQSTTFVSSMEMNGANANGNMMGSKNVKTRLYAIALMIDHKLSQKVSNRRGIWSGNFEEEAKQEQGVEIEYGKQGDLYEC